MAGNQLCYSYTQTVGIPNVCTKYLYIFSPCIPEDLFVTKRVNIPLPAWWCHSWECRMFTHLVTHKKKHSRTFVALRSNKDCGFAELGGLGSLDILGKFLPSTCADCQFCLLTVVFRVTCMWFCFVHPCCTKKKVQFKKCLFCCLYYQNLCLMMMIRCPNY